MTADGSTNGFTSCPSPAASFGRGSSPSRRTHLNIRVGAVVDGSALVSGAGKARTFLSLLGTLWPAMAALLLLVSAGELRSQNIPSFDPYSSQSDSTDPCAPSAGSTGQTDRGSLGTGCLPGSQSNFNLAPQSTIRGARAEPNLYGLNQDTANEDASINPVRGYGTKAPEAPRPPEPLTEFQKFIAATTGQILPVFGARYFRNVPSTFAPVDFAPAMPTYTVGPEDELRVRIWGDINFSENLRVNRSGDIYLPQVGAIHVAGLQFSALDDHLRAAVGRLYRKFDLSVDLGRIRSIQVYISGEAQSPGVFTVSSLSTLVDALFASGGPALDGSMRHIQLKRGGSVVAEFDLYALLISGDKSKDVQLLPGDVIYIPPVGAQVAITGSIRTAAIYELILGETAGDLIDAAGKTSTIASGGKISLERIEDHQHRQATEFEFNAAGLATQLADGDILRVYSILPAYLKTVTLRGNVANPGHFSWHEGMRISDLIPDRDSLVSRDYWWKRSQLGLPANDFQYAGELTSNHQPSNPVDLLPLMQQGKTSSEPGAVRQDKNATPLGLAPTSSELDEQNDSKAAHNQELLRQASQDNEMPRAQNDVRQAAPAINWQYAVIERLDPQTLKTSLIPFDLGKLVLEHDESQNLAVEPGDTVTIFSQADIRVPLDLQTKYVHLEGEFLHSGIYSVAPGETLRDLVIRAGGLTPNAYLYGSEFTRESTRKLQQQRIDEYARRAELDIQRGELALISAATASAQDIASASAARETEQEVVGHLRQLRATGRIVLELKPKSSGIDVIPPIALEDGDRFLVPSTPATVNIVGSVYDQSSFLYHSGAYTLQYLHLAGGMDRNADRKYVFVIRADGSVVSRASFNHSYWETNEFDKLPLYPGDTLVVPEKGVRPTALRGLLDWTQIFSQLAIGAAAVDVLRQ
jgi:protein involved in polysaccharide export with SLBB domain